MQFKHNKKIKVFFENIRFLFYPIVKYHLWLGHEVFVFDFNCNLKKHKWLRKLINNEKIKRIYVKNIAKEHGEAIDQTEVIYSNLKNKKLPQIIASLYGTNEISLIFKKALVREIFKTIYINNYLEYIEKESDEFEILYFIPENYLSNNKLIVENSNYSLKHLRRFRFYRKLILLQFTIQLCERLKYYSAIVLFFLITTVFVTLGKLRKRKSLEPMHFKYAIPIDVVFQVKFKGKRNFDFLLNQCEISKENTIFILNIPVENEWLRLYKDRGYNFLEIKEICGFRKIGKFNYEYSFIIRTAISIIKMLRCWSVHIQFMHAFFVSIRTFVRWQLISNHVTFKNYIYANQESCSQIAINILIRQHGSSSWNYSYALGGPYLRSKGVDHFKNYRHIIYSYLNSDYYLGMNEDAIIYNKLHYQMTKNNYAIGCIYSELVQKTLEYHHKEDYLLKHFNPAEINSKTKIISFFDTTFIDSTDAPTTFQDCIDFYQDILRLLNSLEDILVIIKPSKSEAIYISPKGQWSSPKKGLEIINLWDTLKTDARVFWAGDSGDIPAIMTLSDLVVTHCMSSPTAEALGTRKKALWYEHGNKHRGLMYDKIPGLIAHGYKELEQRIADLLYEISDEEYNEYLDKYIKGKVESFLDGLALTRFRQLLVKSN